MVEFCTTCSQESYCIFPHVMASNERCGRNHIFAWSHFFFLQEIAERVNIGNLPSNGSQPGTVAIVPLPQVYEFAMAAVAAQEVVEPGSSTTDGTGGGAPGLFPTYLSVIFVCIIAAVMRLM